MHRDALGVVRNLAHLKIFTTFHGTNTMVQYMIARNAVSTQVLPVMHAISGF